MAQRIPQSFIDDLLARVDIIDVIDSRVPLKKAGREYKACCPFHGEKTPSFTVSQQKQFYHCFGCGAHGSALSFLIEYERLSFPEAVDELARSVGMTIPVDSPQKLQEQCLSQALHEIMGKASEHFRQHLKHHAAAIDYLKKRGINGITARDYELGYAPEAWHDLEQTLGKTPRDKDHLFQSGMLIRRDNGEYYDRFRDRIMFPIRNLRGHIIGFGGRIIAQGEPKYLNSPETPVFHKGDELYGLYQARQQHRELDKVLVVEGYMDVVSLAQHGVRYAVATLGTAMTESHLKTLLRHTQHIIFCFDGDRAGRAAAWRAAETALPLLGENMQLRFLFLDEGEDPDSTIQKEGREQFELRLLQAQPYSQFFFDQLFKQTDMRGLDAQARVIKQAKPLLERIADPTLRQLLHQHLSERLRLPIAPAQSTGPAPRQAAPRHSSNKTLIPSPVRHALTLLVQRPVLASQLQARPDLSELQLPGVKLLQQMLETLAQRPQLNTGNLIEHWRNSPEGAQLAKLASAEILVPEDKQLHELENTLLLLQRKAQEQLTERLLEKSRYSPLSTIEKQQLNELLLAPHLRPK